MATTITWDIANLERETADGYVYTVHYTVAGFDGTYRSSAYGSVGLQRPEGEMIPFADLTKDMVIGWVKDQFGAEKVAEIEAALEAQIAEQAAPSKATGLPWS
jgi:hypothetical protein